MNAKGEQMLLEHGQKCLRDALSRAEEAQEMRDLVPAENRSELVMNTLAVHTWITDEFAPGEEAPDAPDVEALWDVGRTEGMRDVDLATETVLDAAHRVDEHTRARGLGIYGDAS